MTIEQMREHLLGRYSPEFVNSLPDKQVVAVYFRTLNKKEAKK